ncbi:MAG TPA: pantoate--beta-alanine ligase [Gemmatimonadales bacterium]|nr:pantoate--beta-alanine ligase [Gemmatimonadales bacterium]
MNRVTSIPDLRAWVHAARREGHRIALVPTMGALHEGHLSLVTAARKLAPRVIMSLFVNPLQFGPGEDFERYPRDVERDAKLAEAAGVDLLYLPTVAAMYPPGAEMRVVPGRTAEHWEGEVRPGHFTGVLTVVAKFFNQVQPDVAVFGQKDIQQLTLIRRMVADLDFPIEVVSVPTVRETDGLALSSRNAYLDPVARKHALVLSQGLVSARKAWEGGEKRAESLQNVIIAAFNAVPEATLQYLAIVDPLTLQSVETAEVGTIIAVAARVGSTRLIDNIILG